jgi:hypothetical protein
VRLGILHVERDILRGLTAKELRGWEMYHELEPFGEERADYRAASIVQMLYNINRGKNQKALELKDFLLAFGEQEPKQKQTPEQQFAILKVLAAMHANDVPTVPHVTTGMGLDPAPDPGLTEGGTVVVDGQVITSDTSEDAIKAILEKARKAMH